MDGRDQIAHRPPVISERARAARAEWNRFNGFCAALRVDPRDSDSCIVYLTHLFESDHLSGAQLNRRLGLLDLVRDLDGLPRWRSQTEVRLFMRGLLRTARLQDNREQSDPLYREHVALLIEQTLRPTPKQARLRAGVLLFHHTGWPALAVSRLKWCDIDLRRKERTVVTWPDGFRYPSQRRELVVVDHPDGLHPLRDALTRVRGLADTSPFVTWPPFDYSHTAAPFLVRKAKTVLENCQGDPAAAVWVVSRSPEQVRNRAAMVLGFGTALTTRETLKLKQGHVEVTGSGLVVSVPGRRRQVGIPRDPGTLVDPLDAWEEWISEADSWGLADPEAPVLLDAHNLGLYPHGVGEPGLNRIVQVPAASLRMKGRFGWQSLRFGAIRTAIRDNERTHHVAALAATTLGTVAIHQQREQLISHSVAGQLGL